MTQLHTDISTSPQRQFVAWRSVGMWLSAILIGFMLFSAVSALLDPLAFAASFGLPLVAGETAFVRVYAIRTLFLGLFGLALILRRNYSALAFFLLIATIIPIGDALLVAAQGGATPVVVRHSVTAVIVLLTAWLVRRKV